MNVQTLRIPAKLLAEIESFGARDYPKETCGFLVGKWDSGVAVVTHVLQAGNRHFADPHHHYVIDSPTYLHAESITNKNGLVILGVYHSHPDSPAEPSELDDRHAFPEWFYWIQPVFKGQSHPGEAFYRTADAKAWVSVIIERA